MSQARAATTTAEPYTVSVRQAAERTGLSTWTIYRLSSAGELEVRYYGRKVLVVWASLKAWIDARPDEAPS